MEYELGDLLPYEQPTEYIVESTDYDDSFKTPVLTAGKTFIIGYTNETSGIYSKVPCIIFDDFTTSSQYVDFPFKVKSSAMKILSANKEIADLKYLFYKMQTIQFNSENHKRYWISQYSKIKLDLPTLDEQKRIVSRIESLFTKLDEAKDKAQSVVDGFELRRAAILHKAFTGELTAKWRKENGVKDDSWEEKTIGDICEVTSSKRIYQSEQTSEGIPFLRVADIIHKIQDETFSPELYISEEMYKNLKSQNLVPKENEILVTARGTLGKCYLVKAEDMFYFQDGMISWLKNIDNQVLSTYLIFLFQSKEITKQVEEKQNGSTVNYLSISMLKKFSIPVSTLPEQQEIVRILDSVLEKDRTAKEAAEQVLEQIELLKKSILARAFRGEL